MRANKNIIEFEDGVFKDLCLNFLQYKRRLGLKYEDSVEYVLRAINRELIKYELSSPQLTKEIIEDLASKKIHESPVTQSRRITLLRQFAIFMNQNGFEAYVYPVYYKVHRTDSFIPYIFTSDQIQKIFRVSDSLTYNHTYPRYHIIYPTLLRILYGCGLRLSEALNLKTDDVHLINGALFIHKSKKNTSRFVPMSRSLVENCKAYVKKMNLDMNSNGYFFPAPDLGKYNRGSVRAQIIKIYAKAGMPHLNNGLFPRVHDLRHTFAVHAMEKMEKQGYDMYCSLPILSAYLGHKGIRETEKYLHLSNYKFEDILDSVKQIYTGVIPEVKLNEEE